MMVPESIFRIAVECAPSQYDHHIQYKKRSICDIARKVGHFLSAALFSIGLTFSFQSSTLLLGGTISMAGLAGLALCDDRGAKATLIFEIMEEKLIDEVRCEIIVDNTEDVDIAQVAKSRLHETKQNKVKIILLSFFRGEGNV